MRILVTGGLGFVGSALARELGRRGHAVATCDLLHSEREVAFGFDGDARDASHARCDVAEFRQLERCVERLGPFDLVYHCAGEFGRWNGEDFYEALWRTNVVGTKNLLRLQERQRFRLVHFSSSEVYGDWPQIMLESVVDDYAVRPLNDYALSKWVNEMQIRNARLQHGTESVVVRLFNTYGPGERYSPYRSVNCRFLHCALNRLPWTVYRGHVRTSSFIDDTVRTLANLAERFRSGETYNIAGAQAHSIEQLSDLVLRITGAPAELVRHEDGESQTTRLKQVDAAKALRDLDHQPRVALDEGMRITADWMRAAGRD